MRFQGEIVVKAPVEKVWNFLTDIKASARCIPGCVNIALVDDKTCHALIKSRTSLISAKFNSVISIDSLEPLKSIRAKISGEDKSIGSGFYGKGELNLYPISESKAKAVYLVDLSLYGKLASLGDRVARIKVSTTIKKLASNLAKSMVKNSL